MLAFHCPGDSFDAEAAARRGLRADDGDGLLLYPTLEAAEQQGEAPILVVVTAALSPPLDGLNRATRVSSIPADAIQNLAPYRPPEPVTAGGGYVSRALSDDVALLLIFRRGVWDLPKGTLDPGETIETCAVREVREEVGIDELSLIRSVGTTQHAYPDGDVCAVKTTHWYLMHTPERSFRPERAEGIERVAWARWSVARQHVGYDTLRRHMDRIELDVRDALD